MNGFSARGRYCHVAGLILVVWAVVLSGCDSTRGFSMASINPFRRDKGADAPNGTRPAESVADARTRGAEFSRLMSQGKKSQESGDYVGARKAYQDMIVAFPDRHEGYYRLGVVADHEKRFSEAEALFSQAIGLNPLEPKYHNSLGYCFLLQRKLNDAEAALLKAVALQPSNERFRTNLGMVYGHQERYADALEQFKRAGGVADAYCNLAFVLESRGKVAEAKNAYHIAMRADPSSERASQLLAELESYERDPRAYSNDAPDYDEDGMRWVRYNEQGDSELGDVPAMQTADMPGFTPTYRTGSSVQQVSTSSREAAFEASSPRVSEWGATRPLYE